MWEHNNLTKKLMAKTIARNAPMESKIVLRGTELDKQNLKKAAKATGVDVSTFLRLLLIREGVITADG